VNAMTIDTKRIAMEMMMSKRLPQDRPERRPGSACRARLPFVLLATSLLAAPALAQSAPSDNAMVNLVRLLVEKGVLTADKGEKLIAQAKAEAAQASAAAPAPAPGTAVAAAAPSGTIRVPYVPETVRAQIKQELKTEVLAQAKSEGWAAPGDAAPDWVRRITIGGDLRVRSFSEFYSRNNSDQIIDFARINEVGPFDVFNSPVLPFVNSRQNRSTADFRLRLNIGAKITDRLAVDLQLATGDDRSPISTSETLGGGLRPRNFWVQKAAIIARPTDWSRVWAGRFANPFTAQSLTSEKVQLLFDNDISFDGLAAEINAGKAFEQDFNLTFRGGVFPIEFGSRNNPDFNQTKAKFPTKYLLSGQVEAEHKFGEVDVQLSAAYHSFQNIQGQLSAPCFLYLGAAECSTDGNRPFFQRFGNTVAPLRNIAVDPTLPVGQVQPQPQVFAPTFKFDVLHLTAEATVPVNDRIIVRANGQFIRNLGFKRRDICRNGIAGQPFNNGGTDGDGNICSATNPTRFVGGNTGYQISAQIGSPKVKNWGDWSVTGGYRYIESDAALDSLTDSDFHLGGTNAKGFYIEAGAGLAKNTVFNARYLSANQISGDPFAIDVLQIEVVVSF